MKQYFPKDMWMVRINGANYVIKAKQEKLEELFRNNKIDEYSPLRVYKL